MPPLQPSEPPPRRRARLQGLGVRNEGADRHALGDGMGAEHGEGVAMTGADKGVHVGRVKAPSVVAQVKRTGTFQMSSAYSRMVRSDEKKPMCAVFSTAERHQAAGSRNLAATSRWVVE